MAAITTSPPTDTKTRPTTVKTLIALLALLTIGAFQGGIAMVTDPVSPLGMPLDFLEGTPVSDYFLPGMFLLGVATASVITLAGLTFHWTWGWTSRLESRVGFRWMWIGAVATGTVLLAFELIELFIIPFHPIMHPLLIAWSVALVALPLTRSARGYLRA